MNPEETGPSDRLPMPGQMDPDETREQRASDPDEYAQKRNIKAILDAEEEVREVRKIAFADPDMPHYLACKAYYIAVESYLGVVQPTMCLTHWETGEAYWEGKPQNEDGLHLGKVTIDPPDHIRTEGGTPLTSDVDWVTRPATPTTIPFNGLQSLSQVDWPLSVTFSAGVHQNGREREYTETVERPVPKSILDNAYTAINSFVSEIGIGVDPEDDNRPRYDLTADDI